MFSKRYTADGKPFLFCRADGREWIEEIPVAAKAPVQSLEPKLDIVQSEEIQSLHVPAAEVASESLIEEIPVAAEPKETVEVEAVQELRSETKPIHKSKNREQK